MSAKRSAWPQYPRWQDADLTIKATPEGRIVQRRPLSRSDLPKANRKALAKNAVVAHPFGLVNAATVYQEAMRDCYADQIGHIYPLTEPDLPKADQFAPTINKV